MNRVQNPKTTPRRWRSRISSSRSSTAPSHSGRGSLLNQRGEGKAGCLLLLAVLIVAVYVGVQYLGSEYDYRALNSEVQRQVNLAADHSDEEMLRALNVRIDESELPDAARRILINRQSNRISISLAYADTLRLFGRFEWVIPRRIEHAQNY